jgi:hypothetical protein
VTLPETVEILEPHPQSDVENEVRQPETPTSVMAMMANIQPKFFMLFLPSMTVGEPRSGISADWASPEMPHCAGYLASIVNRAGQSGYLGQFLGRIALRLA